MHTELLIALLAGLCGMLGWGFADLFAKKTIDEIGDIVSLAWAHVFGTIALLLCFTLKILATGKNIPIPTVENAIPEIQAEIDLMRMECLNGDAIIQEAQNLYDSWNTLEPEGKRQIVEQITEAITIGGDEIKFKFSYNPAFFRNDPDWQRNLRDS